MKSVLPILFSTLAAFALGACAKGPDQLARNVEQALAKKDLDAMLASADLRQAPAMAIYMLMALPDDCNAPMACTVSLKPLDAQWQKETDERMAKQNLEWRNKPEGRLHIEGKQDASAADSGKGSMKVDMPYARVDGEYKLVLARYTAARRAELQAMTAQALTEKTLAQGIHNYATHQRDTEWKSKAAALPADGGEPGAVYAASVAKVGAAIKANDLDALAAATGAWGKAVLGPKDFEGKDVPLDRRQRKMRAQAVRMTVSVNVLGGYLLGDQALLVVEGVNGLGAPVRGCVLMERTDGVWNDSGTVVEEIPVDA